MIDQSIKQSINQSHPLTHSPTSTHSLTHSINQSHPLTLSPTHIYSLSSTHPLTHWINQSHPLTHSLTSTHSLTHSLNHSLTHLIGWLIDRSESRRSLIVKSKARLISFHFVSSRYIRILFYKVGRVLENDFLLNKIRQHVAENRNEPVSIMAASFGRKTMLLPQVLWSVLKILISEINSQICRKHVVSSSEIGSPKFILWAIFMEEFHRPNQCLVAFGDYATGRFQHWSFKECQAKLSTPYSILAHIFKHQ